jgi:predicted Zn-dependent protease
MHDFLTRRAMLGGVCSCSALALSGCVTSGPKENVSTGYRPQSSSLEGGLWQVVDQMEKDIRHSPLRIIEPGLNTYLTNLACKLAGDHCSDLRVYVMETPHFNASMAPNGMMQIWSGLLLRCRNEAELAAVISHEIGHYIRRHSVQQLENASNQAAFAAFAGVILTGMTGVNVTGLTQAIALANIFAFSREQEAEADSLGLELMVEAGYAPIAAAQIWSGLVEEMDAGLDAEEREELRSKRDVWTATHPTPNARIRSLTTQAAVRGSSAQRFDQKRYLTAVGPLRDRFMEGELRLQQFDRTLVLVSRLSETYPDDPQIRFYRGEIHRRRHASGDEGRAMQAYGEAVELDERHAPSWRGLGILHRRAGRVAKAQDAFRRYLQFDPAAKDRLMIQSFLGAQS